MKLLFLLQSAIDRSNLPSVHVTVYLATANIGHFATSSGFSYEISGRKKGSSSVEFLIIIDGKAKWSLISISYFLSSRKDFAVGNIQFPFNKWIANLRTNYSFELFLNKFLPNGNYKVAGFLSGLSTSDPTFNISINGQ